MPPAYKVFLNLHASPSGNSTSWRIAASTGRSAASVASSVGRKSKELETKLGFSLFLRSTRGLLAVGPQIRWDAFSHGGLPLKWQREFAVRNRPEGYRLWIGLAMPVM
jgi:hypothetical protein